MHAGWNPNGIFLAMYPNSNMKIHVQSSTPPVVEFDQSVAAWYVRFRHGKVESLTAARERTVTHE